MSELNDSSELQKYSSAVLYVLSAISPPAGYVDTVTSNFLDAIQSSDVCWFHVSYVSGADMLNSHGESV